MAQIVEEMVHRAQFEQFSQSSLVPEEDNDHKKATLDPENINLGQVDKTLENLLSKSNNKNKPKKFKDFLRLNNLPQEQEGNAITQLEVCFSLLTDYRKAHISRSKKCYLRIMVVGNYLKI